MEDIIRRKQDKFERQDVFMVDSAADFPAGTPGNEVALVNKAIVDEINSLAAAQVSGGSSAAQSFGNKDEDLEELMQMLKNMNRAANAFEVEVPGSNLLFRLPRNRSESNLLATARAFHADSEDLKDTFTEYGLAGTFREDLMAKIVEVEAGGAAADSGVEQRGGATQMMFDAARRGMANSRRMDAIVKIKYANNPNKLGAWAIASHLEKAPKRNSGGGSTPNP